MKYVQSAPHYVSPETFRIHYRPEIAVLEDYLNQKFEDFPEGKQTMSFTMCVLLMRMYEQKKRKDL